MLPNDEAEMRKRVGTAFWSGFVTCFLGIATVEAAFFVGWLIG